MRSGRTFFQTEVVLVMEKDGIEVPFTLFDIQKNHIIHKWSQLARILAVVDKHDASTSERVRVAVKILEEIDWQQIF